MKSQNDRKYTIEGRRVSRAEFLKGIKNGKSGADTYQPKTGKPCHCRRGMERDNCPTCEGTGQQIDFAAIRGVRP